jgi:FkbM family methyltransferase
MKRLVCFVHLPKTGGGALAEALGRTVSTERIFWVNSPDKLADWNELGPDEFGEFDVVGGDLFIDQFLKINRPKLIVSVIREPIRRAVSYYRFVTEVAVAHPYYINLPKSNLIEALEIKNFRDEVHDYQCLALSLSRSHRTLLSLSKQDTTNQWMIGEYHNIDVLWQELCDELKWPSTILEKNNLATDAYYHRLATADVVRRLAELNIEDGALVRAVLDSGSGPAKIWRNWEEKGVNGVRLPTEQQVIMQLPSLDEPRNAGVQAIGAPEISRTMGGAPEFLFGSEFRRPVPIAIPRLRVEMTLACRDCDAIPKNTDAGRVLLENGQRVQVMHNGLRVVAGGYGDAWTEELIARSRGHHEPQEELAFHELLKRLPRHATMIELGGNWSYYSLWFLSEAPDNRAVIVVEPDPNSLEVGRRNAALNGLDGRRIEFVQASVGDRSLSRQQFQTETAGTLELPQVTVSELLDGRRINRLDILHCDAQGAELAVIRSSTALLQQGRIGYAVFSTHAELISGDCLTHQRCLALLKETGAVILAEHDVHESYSGDGLIVACWGSEATAGPTIPVSFNRYSSSLFRNPLFDRDEALSAKIRAEREVELLRADAASMRALLLVRERDCNLLEIDLAASRRQEKIGEDALGALEKELGSFKARLAEADRQRARLELNVTALADERSAVVRGRSEASKALAQLRRDFCLVVAQHADEIQSIDGERGKLHDELAAAKAEIQAKSAQVDRWWASADRALRELKSVKASVSWRLTRPVRALQRLGRSVAKLARRPFGTPRDTASTGSSADVWRPHPLSRRQIGRFLHRQRRSVRKRVRRLRGLPPEPNPARVLPAPSRRVATLPNDLPEEAQLILERLARQRELAGHAPLRRTEPG